MRTPSPLEDQVTLPDSGVRPASVTSSSKARNGSVLDLFQESPQRTPETPSSKPKVAAQVLVKTVTQTTSTTLEECKWTTDSTVAERGSTTSEEKAAIQNHLKKSLEKKDYDVSMYYWPVDKPGYRGRVSALARHGLFERTTLSVIVANAIWQAYDVDGNDAATLMESGLQFQIAEHFFCAYFSFEWTVRFFAFKSKRNCIRDPWFRFDSILVSTMVVETWIVTAIMAVASGGGSGSSILGESSLLRIARLMRLTRMLRMGRLLRAVPELLIQLKGLGQAMRSVLTTLALLIICLYIFAVLIRQIMETEDDVQKKHFDSVPKTMYTLLVYAFFMDALGYLIDSLVLGDHYLIVFVFSLCVIASGLAIQNMLIGVLCEVVSGVGIEERASLKRQEVEEKLNAAVKRMGCGEDKTVTKDNFMRIFDDHDEHSIAHLFADVGVDLIGLLDFSDFIFHDELLDEADKTLTFNEFVDVVMQLRGDKEATVKDMVDLRKYLRSQIRTLGTARRDQLNQLQLGISSHHGRLSRKFDKLGEVLGSSPGGIPSALEATAAVVADTGTFAGRLGKVESALAFAKQELHALKVDIELAPVEAEGSRRSSGVT